MDWAKAQSIFLEKENVMKRRLSALLLALLILLSLTVVPAGATDPLPGTGETTILFTHDLHSHFLPQPAENGGESGG